MSTKRNPLNFVYNINQSNVKAVNSTKYLGITITSDVNGKEYVDNIVGKANQRLRFIGRNLKRCNRTTKETAYTTLVRPFLAPSVGSLSGGFYGGHRKSPKKGSSFRIVTIQGRQRFGNDTGSGMAIITTTALISAAWATSESPIANILLRMRKYIVDSHLHR